MSCLFSSALVLIFILFMSFSHKILSNPSLLLPLLVILLSLFLNFHKNVHKIAHTASLASS